MAEKCKLFGDLATRERILGVSDPRLHKRWGRAAKHFNEGVWKANRKYITLVGLYEKFLQNPAMRQHLLSTEDRLLAEASQETPFGASVFEPTTPMPRLHQRGLAKTCWAQPCNKFARFFERRHHQKHRVHQNRAELQTLMPGAFSRYTRTPTKQWLLRPLLR